jgi:small subunit ribosomal protein S6
MVRDYELVLIISPEVTDEALDAVIEKVRTTIGAGGGEVTDVNVWGRRRIAFAVKHFRHGIYATVTAKMAPGATGELERVLSLSEDILRHLLIRLEKAPVKPPVQQPAPQQVPQQQAPQPAAAATVEREQSSDGGNTQ